MDRWLSELRQHLITADQPHGVILIIAADAQQFAAVIDGTTVPQGAGSSEFARIPIVWLEHPAQKVEGVV